MQHTLLWLTEAMVHVFASPAIRPCLTGISGMDWGTSSMLKVWAAPQLPYFSKDMVKEVLRHYVTFSDARVEDAIAAGAEGCPRAVQHVLRVLRDAACNIHGGRDGGVHTVADVLRAAQASWLSAEREKYRHLWATEVHAEAVLQALLAVTLPVPAGGTRMALESAPAVAFPFDYVPAVWYGASHAGVLRLRTVGCGTVVVYPPYPFLWACISSLGARGTTVSHCMHLVAGSTEVLQNARLYHPGRVSQLALALELCMPSSALSLAIAACPELTPLGLTPMALPSHLCQCRTAADLPSNATLQGGAFAEAPTVFIATDDGGATARGTQPGGIGVPFLYRGRVVFVWVELKSCSTADADVSGGLSRLVITCSSSVCPRRMGRVVLADDLLTRCSINVGAVLRSDLAGTAAGNNPLDWCALLFTDSVWRREVAARTTAAVAATARRPETAAAAADEGVAAAVEEELRATHECRAVVLAAVYDNQTAALAVAAGRGAAAAERVAAALAEAAAALKKVADLRRELAAARRGGGAK